MRKTIIYLVAAAAVFIGSPAEAKPAPSPMLVFVHPANAVPITSPTVGEGKRVLDTLSDQERARLLKEGVVVSDARRRGISRG